MGESTLPTLEQLLRITNAVPALLAFVGPDGRYTWGNEAYRTWCGIAPEEIAGRHIREVLGETAWLNIKPFVERALAGEALHFETLMQYDGGPPREVDAQYLPQRDATGTIVGFVILVHDIGPRVVAERSLMQALDELRAESVRKDEFLAMLSHELRNPLAPIISSLQLLESQDGLTNDTRELFQILSRQTAHMRRLLDDLLDVSRLNRGKITLQERSLQLRPVLAQAIEVSAPLIRARRHRLVEDIAAQRAPVWGDPARLVQVFANILNNAAKYTDEGGTITLVAADEEGRAVIRVRDTGIGMTEDLLARVFDPFVQDERTLDRSQGGLGIGLTMVRGLVEMHDGMVCARSDGPGRGSELVVSLPHEAGHAPP